MAEIRSRSSESLGDRNELAGRITSMVAATHAHPKGIGQVRRLAGPAARIPASENCLRGRYAVWEMGSTPVPVWVRASR